MLKTEHNNRNVVAVVDNGTVIPCMRGCGDQLCLTCDCVCLCLCPRSKKTTSAINTKLGTHILILYGKTSASIYTKIKRSKVKVTPLRKPSLCMVTSKGWPPAAAVCCCCRCRTACRYDCLDFLIIIIITVSGTTANRGVGSQLVVDDGQIT